MKGSNNYSKYITKPGVRTNSFMEWRDKTSKYLYEDEILGDDIDDSKIIIPKYNDVTGEYEYVEYDLVY